MPSRYENSLVSIFGIVGLFLVFYCCGELSFDFNYLTNNDIEQLFIKPGDYS